MLIQIESVEKDGPRKVVVTDGDESHEFTAADLKEAHKLIKQGRKDGWDTVTPSKLAAQTKTETAKEVAKVEAGKAASEPKGK